MQHLGRRKRMGFGIILVGFLFLWTGSILFFSLREYCLADAIEGKVCTSLLKTGESQLHFLHMADYNTDIPKGTSMTFKTIPLLSYLTEQKESCKTLPSGKMAAFAARYPGNLAKTLLWSGAAKDKYCEASLFQKADSSLLEEMEKEDGKEEWKQNIVLFQNGSQDITSQNKKGIPIAQNLYKESVEKDSASKLSRNKKMMHTLQKSKSRSYLLKKFYITDSSTSIDNRIFRVSELLSMDLTLPKKKKPQILIFHTHAASERFCDSRKGKKEDSVVGVGAVLAKILSEKYGYQVIHDTTEYDRINGKIDRSRAYNKAYAGVKRALKKYPDIRVVIDLHRDGVGNSVTRTTKINGKSTAQVMFFNGLSRNASGNISYLHNPNLQANLAFSLQLKLASMKQFSDFVRPIYLKGYRYNMHLEKRYTLIELGNENNTVEEAKNAMPPLAKIIADVLGE